MVVVLPFKISATLAKIESIDIPLAYRIDMGNDPDIASFEYFAVAIFRGFCYRKIDSCTEHSYGCSRRYAMIRSIQEA